ncbi:MAG: hypothetical protein ACO3E1_11775 [Flavobacteriales bacterium]
MRKSILILLLIPFGVLAQKATVFSFDTIENRRWIGADFWANRLQNWEVKNGKVYCSRAEELSTLHLLTHEMQSSKGSSEINFEMGRNELAAKDTAAKAGIIIGLSDENLNYKARAMIQRFTLDEDGVWIGIKGNRLFAQDLPTSKILCNVDITPNFKSKESLKIRLLISRTKSNEPRIYLYVDGRFVQEIAISSDNKNGSVAFAVAAGKAGSEFYFNKLSLSNLASKKERAFGPISTCLYTLNDNVLNFSAQLMPINHHENDSIVIEIQHDDKWLTLASLAVKEQQVRLRNMQWNFTQPILYRARLKRNGVYYGNYYEGTIATPNKNANEVRIAAVSCNGMYFISEKGMDYKSVWTPYELLEQKYKELNPDLLVFLGDQMYEARPLFLETNPLLLETDYHYRWLLWCMEMNDLTRRLPTVIMMDDHDYLQGNLWGDGSRLADRHVPDSLPTQYLNHLDDWQTDNGGFVMDVDFLNRAQLLQTGHLPETYSKSENSIKNYFTTLNFNGVGMAVLEDRKFKSAPLKALPNVPSIIGIALNDTIASDSLDNKDAVLLNDEQLKMLEEWSLNWKQQDMKVVFTQSVFACLSSVRKGYVPYVSANISLDSVLPMHTRLAQDMDANGWPKSGRDTALKVIRKSAALIVGGDQHFPSITQQGINDWKDASYTLTIPALCNTYPRFFMPDSSDYYGGNNYKDGFGNKVSMLSYSNPKKNDSLPMWYYGAPGFGFIVCDKLAKTYSLRFMDFANPSTFEKEEIVKVIDNAYSSSLYKTKMIKVKATNPLMTLKDVNGNVLYSLRGNNLQFNVPAKGKYIIEVIGDKEKKKIVKVVVKK